MSIQLNQNEEKDKKLEEENLNPNRIIEENIKNNKSLKYQLKIVSKKIEEVISNYKERKLYGIPINNDDNIKKVDLQKFNEFVYQIEEQKNKTESFKEMLDYDNKYSQITKDENELKYVTKKLLDLKKEYEFLQKINKKQEKGIKILLNNNFNTHQISELEEKLKNLKKDYGKLNENYKNLNLKIKNQNIEINELNKECDLIKENIEIKKPKNKNVNIISNNIIMNNAIKDLTIKIKEKQLNAKNQEESYKNQLNIQNKKKKDIIEEIKLLEKKLESYNHEKKLNELKMKEIKKIKNELNKNKLKEKNDLNLQKIKQQKENLKQINLKKYRILLDNPSENMLNFDLKNYLLEDEKRKTKISNRSFKKPNLNIAKFNNNSKSSINIFSNNNRLTREEKKIKKEKEKEEFIKNLGKELEEHEKQRGKMIQEIEYLKGDIEQMLNKNEIIDKNIDDI